MVMSAQWHSTREEAGELAAHESMEFEGRCEVLLGHLGSLGLLTLVLYSIYSTYTASTCLPRISKLISCLTTNPSSCHVCPSNA